MSRISLSFFFFNDTATTEIYTLSLHDALPILPPRAGGPGSGNARLEEYNGCSGCDQRVWPYWPSGPAGHLRERPPGDRKSTRLNSSHANISYAVFCLKKKKKKKLQLLT